MVNYSCSKCNKVFKQKGHYKAHLNKKFPCSKKSSNILNKEPKKTSKNYKKTGSLQNESEPSNVGGYECEYCHIIIKRKDNLNRHYNRCKSKTNNVENDLKEKMFELLLTKMEKQEENYEKRIELLQEQISKLNTI